MRVFFGLVGVLFVACYCTGCGREGGGLSEGLCWELRRTAGGVFERIGMPHMVEKVQGLIEESGEK